MECEGCGTVFAVDLGPPPKSAEVRW